MIPSEDQSEYVLAVEKNSSPENHLDQVVRLQEEAMDAALRQQNLIGDIDVDEYEPSWGEASPMHEMREATPRYKPIFARSNKEILD